MKIILTAFGNMYSTPMDVPENSGNRWIMALTQPMQVITNFNGEKIDEIPPMPTVCEFEWTGKVDIETGARLYFLRDIFKNKR